MSFPSLSDAMVAERSGVGRRKERDDLLHIDPPPSLFCGKESRIKGALGKCAVF